MDSTGLGRAGARAVRKDVARNRERLLDAAQDAFIADGLSVPAQDVARRAGVSIATLYRHFPNRDSLVDGVYERVSDEWCGLLEEAAAQDDAWEGLVWFFERIGDRATARPSFPELARLLAGIKFQPSERWASAWERLLAQAKEQGVLRADVTGFDVGYLTTSLVTVASVSERHRPGLWRRHLRLLLDGLQASPGGLPDLVSSPEESRSPR